MKEKKSWLKRKIIDFILLVSGGIIFFFGIMGGKKWLMIFGGVILVIWIFMGIGNKEIRAMLHPKYDISPGA